MKKIIFIRLIMMCLVSTIFLQPIKVKAEITYTDAENVVIKQRAAEILLAMRNNDFSQLAKYVHPKKGVRFSSEVSIRIDKDQKWTADRIKTAAKNSKKYMWGYEDGTGAPMQKTFISYYKRYVYPHDFYKLGQVFYNNTGNRGNSINTVCKTYLQSSPKSIAIEYHVPSFEKKYGGLDWQSLWIVLENYSDSWYLIGVVHGQWTI